MRSSQWYRSRRLRRGATALLAGGALLVTAAVPAGAVPAVPDHAASGAPYVVVMEQAPVLGNQLTASATAGASDRGVDTDSPAVRHRVNELRQDHGTALARARVDASAKVSSFTYAVNGFSAVLTPGEARRLSRQPGVARVQRDHLRQLHTDTSPDFLDLNFRHGAWQTGYDGEGVVVGVIDTGIWPEHPSFADDGSYAPPPADWMGGDIACEFGDTAHNPDDLPFECQNKLIGARDMRALYRANVGPEVYNSARDYDGHGTHTASTAAGNQGVEAEILGVPQGTVSGVAPRAHVAAYSACGSLGCFGGDLAAAIDQAVADGVDVINYSIGGGAGLVEVDDLAFLNANAAGVFVASSAGNSGPGAGTVGSPANDPWILGVGASTHDRTFEGSVTLGDGTTLTGATVTDGTDELPLVDAADHGNELCDPTVTFEPAVTGAIVLCARGEIARVDKGRTVFEQDGAGMVLYNQDEAQGQNTDNHWLPSVHIGFNDGQTVKAYIGSAGSGAVASISAGEKSSAQGSVMADFSSRGPNVVAEDIIKPDVTAPGVNILAGASPTPQLGRPGELFQSIGGTSMASPHVAGVLALVKQAHPDWSPAMAHSAVMTSSRQDVVKEDGVTPADPFDMGAGHLQPGKHADKAGSVFDPGLVFHAGFNDYLGFMCEAGPAVFADPEATCDALDAAGIPTTAENLNYPSIGASEVAGTLEVQRTVTSVAQRSRMFVATVDEPEGFDLDVSPKHVRLDPGESATVTITITNEDAPVDEWRFGDITWRGGGYRVYSPVAVKGVALSHPAAVSSTGTTGTASFDVDFGYTGDYTAAAHGLASQADVAGSVDQDPDQTFNPDDPAGTTAHDFTLSGSAHLRLAVTTADLVPPDDSVDLDLYLYNSAGEQVATSTSGGTAEQIDLRLPGDDTYTLYVHGWQTNGLTVDYTLRTWDVAGTAGSASLELTSAPDAAVLGDTGTVEVAWDGLDPGDYLGAVTHTGPDGLLGLTLVEVTTG